MRLKGQTQSPIVGRRRLAALACCSVAVVGLLAGCGSPSESSDTANGAALPASSGLAAAKKIYDAALHGAVLGPGAGSITAENTGPAKASDIKPVALKPSGKNKFAILIPCAAQDPACNGQAKASAVALKGLGWSVRIMPSKDYAPASFQAVWDNAVNLIPDAIVGYGTSGSVIGPQLARAKKAGIYTVFVNGTELSGKGYDAYVPAGWTLSQTTVAAGMITDQNGKANIKWLDAPLFPDLGVKAGIEFVKKNCPDCTLTTTKFDAVQCIDPVKMGQLMSSSIQSQPGLRYLPVPGASCNNDAASQAARTSSSPDAQMVGPNLNYQNQTWLEKGQIPWMVGAPEAWIGLQAVDAVLRGAQGMPGLDPVDYKIGVYLATKATAPANPEFTNGPINAWTIKQFDYVTPYAEAWGIDLSPLTSG